MHWSLLEGLEEGGGAISFNWFLHLVYESFLLNPILLGCVFVFLCEFTYAWLSCVGLEPSKASINQHIQRVSKGKYVYKSKIKNSPALKEKIDELCV